MDVRGCVVLVAPDGDSPSNTANLDGDLRYIGMQRWSLVDGAALLCHPRLLEAEVKPRTRPFERRYQQSRPQPGFEPLSARVIVAAGQVVDQPRWSELLGTAMRDADAAAESFFSVAIPSQQKTAEPGARGRRAVTLPGQSGHGEKQSEIT